MFFSSVPSVFVGQESSLFGRVHVRPISPFGICSVGVVNCSQLEVIHLKKQKKSFQHFKLRKLFPHNSIFKKINYY